MFKPKEVFVKLPFKAKQYPIRHNFLKRAFDIVFSCLVLIISFPFFLLIALGIVCTSKGSIFYFHKRISRGGKKFNVIKFRTMYQNSDALLEDLLKNNPSLKKEWQTFMKLKKDPRITPIGKFLRGTSLDELPQFLNVLKGNLSVVGPRAVLMQEVIQHFGQSAPKILSIRPGITGLWQVSGRNNIPMEERVKLEEKYVDTQSFFLDLILICKTIPVMLFFKGL